MLLKFVTFIHNDTTDWWLYEKKTVCGVIDVISDYNMATVESF